MNISFDSINSLHCLITPQTISSSQYNYQYYNNIQTSSSSSTSSKTHEINNNIVVVGLSYWINQPNENERTIHKIFRIESISDYLL